CSVDADHTAFDCGDLAAGASATYSITGTATQAGTFHYQLALRELVRPFKYVNDHSDGTDVQTWDETITPSYLDIVITRGSGQLGTILSRNFHGRGADVAVIARHVEPAPWTVVAWDGLHAGDWGKQLEGADVVINMAGRSVNCRYNQANRREIMESRIVTTRLVGDAIAKASDPPKLWMNASTATIYTHAVDRPMDEIDGEIGGGEAHLP